jgi:hypothetical protein
MPRSAPSVVRAARAAALLALAATGARAQAPDVVPRDLALALVDAGYAAIPDSATLALGRLPDGFPGAGILPPGGRLLGGARWPGGSTLAVLAVDAAPAAARAGALAAAEAAGWRPPPRRADATFDAYPGFRSSPAPDPIAEATRCAPNGGGAVVVSARARADGPGALVRLLAYTPARAAARCRPAPPAGRDRFPEALRPPLGTLAPPPDVRVAAGGTGRSGGSSSAAYNATATATGPSADPARLRAHYAGQLAAAGWTPVAAPGGDGTRATPLFLSPWDSAGGRWAGVVTAERDTSAPAAARDTTVALTLVVTLVQPGRGASAAAGRMVGFASTAWRTVHRPEGPASAGGRAGGPARRDSRPAVPRELVDAMLSLTLFTPDATGAPAAVAVGRAPAGWSAPLPAVPGRQVLGGVAESSPVLGALLAVAVPGDPAAAQAAYLRQLDAGGWHPSAALDVDGVVASGFLGSAVTPARTTVRCAATRDAMLTIEATPRAAGGTLLRLYAQGGEASALACAPADTSGPEGQWRARLRREVRAPLPALAAPAGLQVVGGGSSGSSRGWEAAAVVRGAASASAAVSAYAPQLRAAGWTVGAPAVGDGVAAARLERAARPGSPAAAAPRTGRRGPAC